MDGNGLERAGTKSQVSRHFARLIQGLMVPHHPGDTIAVHYRANEGGDRTANVTLVDGPPA